MREFLEVQRRTEMVADHFQLSLQNPAISDSW